MKLTIDLRPDGPLLKSDDIAFLLDRGASPAQIGGAMKVAALGEVLRVSEEYRGKITDASAAKLAAYKIKEEIARDPSAADPAELALIDREAVARGQSREELIASISAQASAFRQIALLIEVLEAETGAAIATISDDAPNIDEQITTVLGAAKAQAETAFNQALALIKGGS